MADKVPWLLRAPLMLSKRTARRATQAATNTPAPPPVYAGGPTAPRVCICRAAPHAAAAAPRCQVGWHTVRLHTVALRNVCKHIATLAAGCMMGRVSTTSALSELRQAVVRRHHTALLPVQSRRVVSVHDVFSPPPALQDPAAPVHPQRGCRGRAQRQAVRLPAAAPAAGCGLLQHQRR